MVGSLVILTSWTSEEYRQSLRDAALDHYLTRPAEPAILQCFSHEAEGPCRGAVFTRNRPPRRQFALNRRLGKEQEALGPARFAGCNSYGQIARAEGQFGGFHNSTAVIGVLPE